MLLKYSRRLFSNVCNLIVLVSSCSHEYFIWHPQVIAGEEDLGDLLAHLKIAGRGEQRPYQFEAVKGQEFSLFSRENVFCQYEAACDMEGTE